MQTRLRKLRLLAVWSLGWHRWGSQSCRGTGQAGEVSDVQNKPIPLGLLRCWAWTAGARFRACGAWKLPYCTALSLLFFEVLALFPWINWQGGHVIALKTGNSSRMVKRIAFNQLFLWGIFGLSTGILITGWSSRAWYIASIKIGMRCSSWPSLHHQWQARIWAMFISGCALWGVWGQWMCLEGLMADTNEEHEANWAVKELKGGTWDCNNVVWVLLNYSVWKKRVGSIIEKRLCCYEIVAQSKLLQLWHIPGGHCQEFSGAFVAVSLERQLVGLAGECWIEEWEVPVQLQWEQNSSLGEDASAEGFLCSLTALVNCPVSTGTLWAAAGV